MHAQSPRRSKVFRKPVIWLCCSLLFSSPGSHTRTDATRMSWPATGAPTTEAHWSLAPGEDHDDLQLHAVPLLRCSEHASSSMQSSNLKQQGRTPPRCMNIQQQVAGTSQRSIKKPCLSGRRVPGTSLSRIMSGRNLPEPPLNKVLTVSHNPMSDMWPKDSVNRNMSGIRVLLEVNRNMPGMTACTQCNRKHVRHESRTLITLHLQPCWLQKA